MLIINKIITIGIDQGIRNCGYAVIEKIDDKERILEKGTWVTSSDWELGQRLAYLKEQIDNLIISYNPKVIACEKLFCNAPSEYDSNKMKNKSTKYGGNKMRNKSASIVYTNMSSAMVCLSAYEHKIQFEEIPPPSVKKQITGSGKSNKKEVEDEIKKQLNMNLFKEISYISYCNNSYLSSPCNNSISNHAFDAIGIGLALARKHILE